MNWLHSSSNTLKQALASASRQQDKIAVRILAVELSVRRS
jgi:hypothetical protein